MIRGQSKWLIGLLLISVLTNIVLGFRLQYPAAWHRWRLAMIPPPQLTSADHIRGPENSATTVIVYTNYQCSYCAKLNAELTALSAELNFRWAYRHHTDKNQVLAFKAAEAAECAGEQGKFWEYSDLLFGDPKTLSEERIYQFAEQLKLDTAGFRQCISEGKHRDRLIADKQQAAENQKITATPTYFINGKRFVGSKSYADLKELMLN